uniref:Phosphodiesterase n=1 Tax=Hyaloperonospora arabidopsidis (strain Emoy2) TaxID=559515 RepID=M4BFL8_HYAAE
MGSMQQDPAASKVRARTLDPTQHSVSGSTSVSSYEGSDGDDVMQRTCSRRRRRESTATAGSSVKLNDLNRDHRNYDRCSRSSSNCTTTTTTTRSASALSFVNGVLSWLMVRTGTPCTSLEQQNEKLEESADLCLVEQTHGAFWELVQRILDLNDVVLMIRVLLDFLQDDLGVAAAAVFLVDQSSQSMSRITRGAPTQSGLVPSRGLVGEVLQSRQAKFLDDFSSIEGYDPEVDLAHDFSEQKLLCVPLMERGSVYAIVEATTAHSTQRVMDDLYIKLLTWLGPLLSSCMRKCIEFHDVLLSERTQKALLHIISSSDTEDTVLNLVDGVIDGACHITKAESVSLFMIDWETEELWSLSSSYYDETLRVPLRDSMLGLAATTQQTLNVQGPDADPRYKWSIDQRRGIHTRCVLYVPVGIQRSSQNNETSAAGSSSRPIAVIEIINKVEELPGGLTSGCCQGFTFDDECALEAFACEVAVILRRRSTEIEYIKLLADTRAEQVLAKRARSQVNLLECYTSYASAAHTHPEACLRNSFVPSDRHVADCSGCAATAKLKDQVDLPALATAVFAKNSVSDHVKQQFGKVIGHKKQNSGRLGYEFAGSSYHIPSQLLFSAPQGSRFPSWDFNVFTTDPAVLPKLLEEMYLDFKVDEVLHTTKHRLQNFIVAMKDHYHPNPFHNFLHAFSVVHASYLLLSTTDAGQMLQPLDIAACLVASLGHDVDHPGHTNDFEVKSGSQLAMLYCDESVLEHHHAYTTFRLIFKEKNANILQNMNSTDYRHFRKMVINAILGTDMANHFKFLEAIEKTLRPTSHHVDTTAISSAKRDNSSVTAIIAVSSGAKPRLDIATADDQEKEILNVLRDAVMQHDENVLVTPTDDTSGPSLSPFHQVIGAKCASASGRSRNGGWAFNGTVEDRLFLVKMLVHASDLSGQVFPKPIALKWSNMISKEFAYQALMEQAENIPISYRNIDDPLKMVEGQLFFAQKIVSPLWDLMYIIFPNIDECMLNLRSNVAHYEQELQRLKQERFGESDGADHMREECDELEQKCKVEEANERRARRDSMCSSEDAGVAVPGLARHNPAKFNSFRTIPEDDSSSNSNSEDIDADLDVESGVAAGALAAAERSRKAARSRSNSISSKSSSDFELDEQSLEVYE